MQNGPAVAYSYLGPALLGLTSVFLSLSAAGFAETAIASGYEALQLEAFVQRADISPALRPGLLHQQETLEAKRNTALTGAGLSLLLGCFSIYFSTTRALTVAVRRREREETHAPSNPQLKTQEKSDWLFYNSLTYNGRL